MTWFGWLLAIFLLFDTLVAIAKIGKRREPLTPSTVVVMTIIHAALLVGLFTVGTGKLID